MSTSDAQAVPRINPSTGNYLTLRANRFIDHWLKSGNGTESARIAGFGGDDNSLASAASRMLRNVKVSSEIKRRLGKSILTSQEVLEGLSTHARADLADVLELDGSFDIRSAKRRGVSPLLKKLKVKRRIEHDKDGNSTEFIDHELEIHDSQAALVHLGKYHKLFTDVTETVNTTIKVERKELTVILQSSLSAGLDEAIDVTERDSEE